MKEFKPRDLGRSDGADASVTSMLRAAYASPRDESYWVGLEQRVMSRLNNSPVTAWWHVMSEFRMIGAVAAVLALLLAGGTVVREVSLEQSAREIAARAAIESGMPSDDATLSFRTGKRLPADAPERYLDPFDY